MRSHVLFTLIISGMVFCLSGVGFGATAEELTGQWEQDEEVTLAFYGNGIGRMVEDGEWKYFQYTFLSDETLSVEIGQDDVRHWQFELSGAELEITKEGEVTTTFLHGNDDLSVCERQLHQLVGAKALFFKENSQDEQISFSDLMAYLEEIPQCPEGGMYFIDRRGVPPRCTVPGHDLGSEE